MQTDITSEILSIQMNVAIKINAKHSNKFLPLICQI